MSYQLANLAVRFNVGGRSFHQFIKLPKTTLSLEIASLLKRQGLIQSFSVGSQFIEVKLKYFQRKPFIKSIQVISTPGHRVCWSLGKLSRSYSGRALGGFFVISTPRGIFTSNECLTTLGISGEILYKITLN